MPFIAFLAALLVVFIFVLSTPFLMIVRYRIGTARRPARRWIATINLLSLLVSAALFLWIAALTNFWVRHAFASSLVGFVSGGFLGLLGLAVTRWEKTATVTYYTPNRWLVSLITLAVAARMLYGFWRIWHAWRTAGTDSSWLASAGIPGSIAVGALVIGYHLIYFAGVFRRLGSRMPSPVPPMVVLVCFLGFTGCHLLDSDFPTEDQMRARLRVGMTEREVRSALGSPATSNHDESGVAHLFYISSLGNRTVAKEGYIGFEVTVADGKVANWRIMRSNPSFGPTRMPRTLKWEGYLLIAFFLGCVLYGVYRGVTRGLSEEQIIAKNYNERHIPPLPQEFRFINNDTTLQEVFDRAGSPTSERKLPIDHKLAGSGYGFVAGPLGAPSIVLLEYDLPYHAQVVLMPEYPFTPENRIRAAFYRGPIRDEDF